MALLPPSDDPGWRPAMQGIWWLLIPGQLIRQQRRGAQAGVNGLTMFRRVFLSFVVALVLIGVVVVVLSSTRALDRPALPIAVVAGAIIALGAAGLAAPGVVQRPLDCSDDARLAASYRTRFFVRVASSEVASLAGFAGFVLTNAWWLYALGAAFTATGYYRLAPTAANLAKDQRLLGDASCSRSLISALAQIPAPDGPR